MPRLLVALLLGFLAHRAFADEPEAIVGGTQAVPREFPYQCSLNVKGHHVCGCSIVSATKILTAAHCVHEIMSPPYDNVRVLTGSVDNRAGNAHAVKAAKIHSGYQPSAEKSWLNDVAVITLKKPIKFSGYESPVKLADSPPQAGAKCVLSGWGRTSTDGSGSRNLLKMNTALVDKSHCAKSHKLQIHSSQICALTRQGIGACRGDSGGPLVCNGRQYGVASFVTPCAKGVPDVYTSVYHQRDFIKREIAN